MIIGHRYCFLELCVRTVFVGSQSLFELKFRLIAALFEDRYHCRCRRKGQRTSGANRVQFSGLQAIRSCFASLGSWTQAVASDCIQTASAQAVASSRSYVGCFGTRFTGACWRIAFEDLGLLG